MCLEDSEICRCHCHYSDGVYHFAPCCYCEHLYKIPGECPLCKIEQEA